MAQAGAPLQLLSINPSVFEVLNFVHFCKEAPCGVLL